MSHVPPRLKELNFEVKVYENYKQVEVLDIITNGERPTAQTVRSVITPVQCILTNALPHQLPRPTIRTLIASWWFSWATERTITSTPSTIRSASRMSRLCSKEISARALWESQRSLFYRYAEARSNPRVPVGALVMRLCVRLSLSTGMPWRQTRRAGDGCRFWWRGQRVENKRGGSGRQRCSHPSRRGRFHHVLLSGWRWGARSLSPCGYTVACLTIVADISVRPGWRRWVVIDPL